MGLISDLRSLIAEVRLLRDAANAAHTSNREVLSLVLQISQTQADATNRMLALHERLYLDMSQTPELREPVDGEAFGWAFDRDELKKQGPQA